MKKKKYNMGGELGNEPPQGNKLKAKNAKAMVNILNVLKGRYAYVPESYHNMLDMIIIKNLEDKAYGSVQHSTYSKSADKIYEKKNGGTLEPGPKGVKPPAKAKTHPRWEVGYKDPAWENVVEGLPLPLIAYPVTFMTGIDDVVRSYKDPSHTKFDTALEIAGILPIVGNKTKHRVADYISKDVVAPIVKKLPLWYADKAQKAGNAVQAGFDIYNDNISGNQSVNQKPAPRMKEYQYGGMLDNSSKDYINKKWKYAEGGALDAVLPAVPALLGAINPALGAVAGVGVSMYKQSQAQQEMDAQQGQRMVNTNPYGYASGGALQTASPGSRGRRKKFNAFPALLTAAAAGLGAAALYRQNNMAAQQGMQERLNQQPMPAQLMAPAQPVQPAYSEAFSPVSNQMMDAMGTGLPSYATYAEKGGMLTGREGAAMFVGDKHSAPSGGIAVTPNGVPMPASNQLVEGGEVSYKLRDGRTYIFSEKLKI